MTEVRRILNHLAIIPDGNRRWARGRGLPSNEGHRIGFLEVTPRLLRTAWERRLHTVTLWLFSTENWKRSEEEVEHLMNIYEEFLSLMLPIAQQSGVRIRHLGRKDRISKSLLSLINRVECKTKDFDSHLFNFALDYGGRDEIVETLRKLLQICPAIEDVNEKLIDRFLQTGEQLYPNPDLIIRTSGEMRSSGFMPWQSCYSEFYFVEKYYPDFSCDDLNQAFTAFLARKRRFGK